jgi:hypothetical protein
VSDALGLAALAALAAAGAGVAFAFFTLPECRSVCANRYPPPATDPSPTNTSARRLSRNGASKPIGCVL